MGDDNVEKTSSKNEKNPSVEELLKRIEKEEMEAGDASVKAMKKAVEMKKRKDKKTNTIMLCILGVSIVVVIAGMFIFSTDKENSGYFLIEYHVACETMLDNLINSTENYPKTPEEVTKAYLSGYELLYTGKLANHEVIPIVVEAQRAFTSEQLNAYNPEAIQIENIINVVDALEEEGLKFINIQTSPAIYDQKDNNIAYVRVSQNDNKFTNYYNLYHLSRETAEDNWKITAWYNTDENFNRVD